MNQPSTDCKTRNKRIVYELGGWQRRAERFMMSDLWPRLQRILSSETSSWAALELMRKAGFIWYSVYWDNPTFEMSVGPIFVSRIGMNGLMRKVIKIEKEMEAQ